MKAFWIVGVLLLVGMIVGVRLLFMGSAAQADVNDPNVSNPERIVCWGNFDVEKGVARLYPRQFGTVAYVHAESAKAKEGERVRVKKDELLLQVDDGVAQLTVLEAEAAVRASEQQLAQAKQLPDLYKIQKERQQSAIKAIELEIQQFKVELDSKLLGLEEQNPKLAKLYRDLAKFGEDKLKEKQKAEEGTLREIELQDADLKIKQAEADLDAKKVTVKKAQEVVKYHKILAPSDGFVLRVHTREAEALGPNPMSPAIEFVPDLPIIVRAEVLQEWGRHVKPGAEVTIEDDTYKGPEWKGIVRRVSTWYATTRSPVIEPFRYNDVRTLECIIDVTEGSSEKMIGQRVRARIKIEK